jgi:Bacteriophage Sf6, terminase small subunit-like
MRGMPSLSSVMAWCSEDATFARQYAFACEARADALADEILDIADDPTTDWTDYENIRRARLKIDVLKWIAARMAPKRYGVR